jgi:hypothetical protein
VLLAIVGMIRRENNCETTHDKALHWECIKKQYLSGHTIHFNSMGSNVCKVEIGT